VRVVCSDREAAVSSDEGAVTFQRLRFLRAASDLAGGITHMCMPPARHAWPNTSCAAAVFNGKSKRTSGRGGDELHALPFLAEPGILQAEKNMIV